MANPNAPYGLRPARRIDGGIAGRVNGDYSIASGLAANIGIGSLVKRTGTGTNITISATTNTHVGVFAGCYYPSADGNFLVFSKQWISGTTTLNSVDAQALVYDDPQILFSAQSDVTGIAATDPGQFFAVTVGAPNTLGIAQTVASGVTGSITDLKLVELSATPGNAYGAYAQGIFFIAKHEYRDPLVAS